MSRGRRRCSGRRAERLEALAARTTAGDWRLGGLLASRPEVVAHGPDGGTEHVAEAARRRADWIAALSPAVAAPLVAWLRARRTREPVDAEAVGLATDPCSGGLRAGRWRID